MKSGAAQNYGTMVGIVARNK